MKRIIAIILIITLSLLVLISCGETTAQTTTPGKTEVSGTYKTDVVPKDIYTALTQIATTDKELYIYAPVEDVYNGAEYAGSSMIKYRLKLEDNDYTDCFVCSTGGNSCFEYGVIKTQSEDKAELVKATVTSYITALSKDELALSYSPEDKLILDNAKVVVIGNYVVYTLLDEETSATLISRVKDMLTAK